MKVLKTSPISVTMIKPWFFVNLKLYRLVLNREAKQKKKKEIMKKKKIKEEREDYERYTQ